MAVADVEVEVLIVGGGPVGLAARALLDRWGVRTLLVEKHDGLSPFPRSRLVNVRSMEIFRRIGVAEAITAQAFPPEFGRIRFRDTLRDHDFATAGMVGINAPIPESPALGVITSQDRLEPTLLAAADSPVRFWVELTDLIEAGDGVVGVLTDHRGGGTTRVHARYVLAADGANSTVRQLLGIGTTGPGALGRFTIVVFDADLRRWSADQPAGVYFTARGSFAPLYPEGGWAWVGPSPEQGSDPEWPDLISRSLGPGPEVKVEVLRLQHWVMNAFVAQRFTHGRILLAGDAAHAVPVFGGMGMNAGIADVHNLCWKLAGVLRGWAAPGLLETYEPERHPVAERTLAQAVANTRRAVEVQRRRHDQLQHGSTASEQVELPWTDRFFDQLELILGYAYASDAVLAENTAPASADAALPASAAPALAAGTTPAFSDADPAAPGRRVPHLVAAGRSTLDACGEWFTVLTADPARWRRYAAAQSSTAAYPLRVEPLSVAQAAHCGLGPHGALLVRPDDHIAARFGGPPGDDTLGTALAAVTGH
ncbi:FAD-dependent monooxygenase [Nocardia sp. 2]|uniref:FAD-dependent monooxygenase n=1 Tax=Nocardia acididurans TaxID=2802282 RepID=A0ABS1M8K1_9NOCA|nr:FAD-dependent monooxygenase [Nocardia acididurans]MBL1076921.1 FAD-dependent monooxygenase [Nocardia acididurans]